MKDAIIAQKRVLRLTMRQKRGECRQQIEGCDARQVAEGVRSLPMWDRATRIAVYMPTPFEIPVTGVVSACRGEQKAVFVPAMVQNDHYQWTRWTLSSNLITGPYGIQQPDQLVPPDGPLEIILVPGLAFDPAGGRLGHGAGCYDRLLSEPLAVHAFRVGLLFRFQLLPDLPRENHDVAMHALLDEYGARVQMVSFNTLK